MLGNMDSLRVLYLHEGGLHAVPAFVGELKSLEVILFGNDERIYNTLDFLIKGCPHLPVVKLSRFIRVQI